MKLQDTLPKERVNKTKTEMESVKARSMGREEEQQKERERNRKGSQEGSRAEVEDKVNSHLWHHNVETCKCSCFGRDRSV